jgi:type I restriction enzyme R subunit
VLHGLNDALDLYGTMAGYDPADLDETLVDISEKLRQLPQAHSDLWDVFKSIRNERDQEAYERLLADDELRSQFYERLTVFARLLGPALGSVKFLETTPEKKVETYKRDLKFFAALRRSVGRRYADMVDYGEYEPRVRKLLDRHVSAGEVETITPSVNIFDQNAFAKVVEEGKTQAAQADTIAYATKKTIHERMDEDPAFYKRFSILLEETIEEWRAKRLSDADYLRRVSQIRDSVRDRTGDEVPEPVRYQPDARAFFGLVKETIAPYAAGDRSLDAIGAETALAIDRIIEERRVVNWTDNPDVQNRMRTAIEDQLFELKERDGLPLTLEDIDDVMERVLDVAKRRKA